MEYTENIKYSFQSEMRIVICGSMGAFKTMQEIQSSLIENNIRAIIPQPEDHLKPNLTPEEFSEFKRKVSHAYLRKIRDPRTFGVLAVNPDKYEIQNYIGPNTFAEIAVAFTQHKRIFILNGIPSVYEDEIIAWRGMCLNGDLGRLIDIYNSSVKKNLTQLTLF